MHYDYKMIDDINNIKWLMSVKLFTIEGDG